jgi:DNA-binding response OmpR family regulator
MSLLNDDLPPAAALSRQLRDGNMLQGQRLLIVEEEFMIAMDIQRVLEDAQAAKTVFARNYKELATLERRFGEFDVAIVTPPKAGTSDRLVAAKLAAAGPVIVVCSATRPDLLGTGLEGSPIVVKPFADDDLLDACRKALARGA